MRFITSAMLLVAVLGSPAFGAGPTCALLDPDKDPRAALLEAKLLTDASATWVERVGIDKVLKEQKLQALFSPQGVGERVRLGQLLKADVLVMVRAVKGAESPTLEVVVSETASGLRLMHRAVPITKSTNDDVAALLAAVREGIKRHGEKITEVVAVPPFVNNDLELVHDYLKGALSKLAEGEALGRKGVVVVELAEAEALAKEIALTTPGTKIDRPLPVYLLGEFRNEGKGKDRTVSLKLRAERGGKLLVKAAELKSKAGEESDAVRKWAAQALDALAKDDKPRPPADAKAEAKQLADRAKVFARLSNWDESLVLVEASLLLDPGQAALHVEAVKLLVPSIRLAWLKAQQEAAGAERMAVLYRRALEHFEAFFVLGGNPADYRERAGGNFDTDLRGSVNSLIWTGMPPKRVMEVFEELRKEEREVLLRIIPAAAKHGGRNDMVYVSWALGHLPLKEKYEALEKIVIDLRNLPNHTSRIVLYASFGYVTPPDSPEFRAFLDRLAASDDKARQQAANILRAQVNRKVAQTPQPANTGPGPGAVKFTPVSLNSGAGASATFRGRAAIVGLLAVGEKRDVLWSSEALYVMKEKGKLKLAWRGEGANVGLFGFSSVSFDGKYVWATLPRPKGHPMLLVLDPETEKVWDVSESEGVPRATEQEVVGRAGLPTIMATPLGEGRACLVGSFHGRAWVGVTTFDATSGKATTKVIHEAKDAPDRADADQWKSTTVAFQPTFVAALTGKPGAGGKVERRVFISREVQANVRVQESPLVIDPDRGTAEVLNHYGWSIKQWQAVVVDGALCIPPSAPGGRQFVRYAAPALTREVLVNRLSSSQHSNARIAFHDNRFHVIIEEFGKKAPEPVRVGGVYIIQQYQWVTVDKDGKNSRMIANEIPMLRGVWVSSHYGLVAVIEDKDSRMMTLNTVEILDPAPKK